jgi:hypothetical protein
MALKSSGTRSRLSLPDGRSGTAVWSKLSPPGDQFHRDAERRVRHCREEAAAAAGDAPQYCAQACSGSGQRDAVAIVDEILRSGPAVGPRLCPLISGAPKICRTPSSRPSDEGRRYDPDRRRHPRGQSKDDNRPGASEEVAHNVQLSVEAAEGGLISAVPISRAIIARGDLCRQDLSRRESG